MWSQSIWAHSQLAQSHTVASRLDILQNGRKVAQLGLIDGEVDRAIRRPVMSNMTTSVVDPTGDYSDGDIDDLLSPYESEVMPWRGVMDPTTGYSEMVPLGVFRITGRDPNGDGSVSITGQDRAIMYQGGMVGPTAINAGTPIETAIAMLLSKRNPGLVMHAWKTGFTCGPLLFASDVDVWGEALKLAESAGGWLWHTRTGELTFGHSAPSTIRPIDRYASGDGRLISVKPTENVDQVVNIVTAESTKTATGGVITATVSDDDPRSPTNINSAYGRHPETVTNPHIGSIDQAKQVASSKLTYNLGRSQVVVATTVVDAWKDPNDVVIFHRPKVGLYERPVTIEGLKTPLGKGQMSITGTRSVLTRDGRILDMPAGTSL